MLKLGDKIALVAMSNGLAKSRQDEVENLAHYLIGLGFELVLGQYLYESDKRQASKRVAELHDFYRDETIHVIFDISGGDLANETLTYLDFELLGQSEKTFVGYSDLTTILNALYKKANQQSYLYQLRHLADPENSIGRERFEAYLYQEDLSFLMPSWRFVQGSSLKGALVGGNVRCLLKLAGTPYLPDFKDKVLFLESFGGDEKRITTYFHQLAQMDVFNEVNGVLLGTFTELEKEKGITSAIEILKDVVGKPTFPLAITREVGHGQTSKALNIGGEFTLQRKKG